MWFCWTLTSSGQKPQKGIHLEKQAEEGRFTKKQALIGSIILTLLCLIVVSTLVINAGNGADQYLGVWKAGNTGVWIEPKPEKKVKEVLILKDGLVAKLMLPVRVRSVNGPDLWLMTREGIYDIAGQHALISFCEICRTYVVFGIRRNSADMEVGFPKYRGEKDTDIQDAMWP